MHIGNDKSYLGTPKVYELKKECSEFLMYRILLKQTSGKNTSSEDQ